LFAYAKGVDKYIEYFNAERQYSINYDRSLIELAQPFSKESGKSRI